MSDQRVFRFSASQILSGHAPGEFRLEQKLFFRDLVPKVGHGDLVGIVFGITGVSATFNFFVVLTFVRFFRSLQANG